MRKLSPPAISMRSAVSHRMRAISLFSTGNILTLPRLKVGDCFPASTRNAGLRQTDWQSTGVSRLRVSLGNDPETFGSHVFGSVPVPQVVGATSGTGPLAIGERKLVVLISAFKTELRREPVHLDKVLAVPQGICHLGQLWPAADPLDSPCASDWDKIRPSVE